MSHKERLMFFSGQVSELMDLARLMVRRGKKETAADIFELAAEFRRKLEEEQKKDQKEED